MRKSNLVNGYRQYHASIIPKKKTNKKTQYQQQLEAFESSKGGQCMDKHIIYKLVQQNHCSLTLKYHL